MSNAALLITLYPRLYHMAHAGSWPAIRRHGLLSTTALLDLFEIHGERRTELESRVRSKSEEILHPVHGRALLRDQRPLNEKKLTSALDDGLSPCDWYHALNRKVFFWGPETRLKILQGAREYAGDRQTIVVADSTELVRRYGDRILLCHMNSGATMPMAFRRGNNTFLPIGQYALADRLKKYGRKNAVAEVTVDYSVPDIAEFVVEVFEVGGGQAKIDLL